MKEQKYNCIYCKYYNRRDNNVHNGGCIKKYPTLYFQYYGSDWGRVRKDSRCDDFELNYYIPDDSIEMIYAGYSKE